MKVRLVSLAMVCFGMLTVLSVLQAQAPIALPEIPGQAVYIPFPVDIKVDGKLDDWAAIPMITVKKGTLLSKDPAKVGFFRFALAANDNSLFLVMTAPDNNIITGKHGGDLWNEDSFEFYLNASSNFGLTSYNENIYQLRIMPGDIGNTDPAKFSLTGTNFDNAKVQAIVFKTTDGWGFESAIDLKSLGVVPAHGLNIGFNAQANGASVKDRDIKLIWSAADTKDTSYLDPSVFGRAIFFKVGSTDVPPISAGQAATAAPTAAGPAPVVKVNPNGYPPNGQKTGTLATADRAALKWSLMDTASYQEVAGGLTSEGAADAASGQSIHKADFSSYTTPGIYQLVINSVASDPFLIGDQAATTPAAVLMPDVPAAIQGLHVSGNAILNAADQPVIVHGVNRSGGEFMCIQNRGIWDGPSDAASVKAMLAWHINAVRVPLNEDCWLNINGVNPAYAGETYQKAVADFVNLLNTNGLIAILDLHWAAPDTTPATKQLAMPDTDHSLAFWQGVAAAFKGNSAVMFDVFNEPYPGSNSDSSAAWLCWRDGGSCPGLKFKVAGMQSLVSAIRKTGSSHIILLGGLQYSNAMSQWLTYKPYDPTGNLVASWHSYNFNPCIDTTCWDSKLAPVIQKVPLIAGEIGENDCGHGYIDKLMAWLDAHKTGYLAWTWDAWTDPCTNPILITDYQGTATAYGIGFQNHLAVLAGASTLPEPATKQP